VTLFDGKGGRFECVIDAIEASGTVRAKVTKRLDAAPPAAALHLFQGLLKASHWDDVLDKATQLGVASFTPVLTPRTVVVLREADRTKAKRERWERIVVAAAKQCQRGTLPEVREAVQFRDAIRASRAQDGVVTLVAWEGLCGAPAALRLKPALAEAKTVHLYVGPEGGFTDEEIELADSLGAVTLGLGPRILRAETAAIAACAAVQYELGGL
jgi:16S rRNA (uracil1498-N3)-methyltransferase